MNNNKCIETAVQIFLSFVWPKSGGGGGVGNDLWNLSEYLLWDLPEM